MRLWKMKVFFVLDESFILTFKIKSTISTLLAKQRVDRDIITKLNQTMAQMAVI